MKNARIIAVLVLLALSLSGCANVDRSEVSAPSSQETVMAEPAPVSYTHLTLPTT